MNPTTLESLLDESTGLRERIASFKEVLLANLVMVGEIPAPTWQEENRIRFLTDRFRECGLDQISTDELNNAVAVLPGTEGTSNILVGAHVDTVFTSAVDHTVRIDPKTASGPGVADNSLGLAAIASMPDLLSGLGVQLKSNLVLMGSTRSLGRGNLEGIRFFLENTTIDPIRAATLIEGVHLGRLSYNSLGALRAEIHCKIPEDYNWSEFGASGAIAVLNDVITGIQRLPIPKRPRTSVVLGSINAGNAYNTVAMRGSLQLELRSEDTEMVSVIGQRISDIVEETASITQTSVWMEDIARRAPGGISFTHPLTRCARDVMERLEITPVVAPSSGELSALIDAGIPGITLGLTRGSNVHTIQEAIEIEPMFSGLTQLITILQAIDAGLCDEPKI